MERDITQDLLFASWQPKCRVTSELLSVSWQPVILHHAASDIPSVSWWPNCITSNLLSVSWQLNSHIMSRFQVTYLPSVDGRSCIMSNLLSTSSNQSHYIMFRGIPSVSWQLSSHVTSNFLSTDSRSHVMLQVTYFLSVNGQRTVSHFTSTTSKSKEAKDQNSFEFTTNCLTICNSEVSIKFRMFSASISNSTKDGTILLFHFIAS